MKKKINISFKRIAIVLFIIFINLFIWYSLLSNLINTNLIDSSYKNIIDKFPTFAIIVGILIIICLFLIFFKKNISFELDKKSLKRYATFNKLTGFIALFIFIVIASSYNSFVRYFNEREYKDLVYSLKDNSERDNIVTEKDVTKNYKELHNDLFLGYRMEDKEVFDSYVCFIYDKKLTCLKGFDKKAYKSNTEKLLKAFGKDKCYENNEMYSCNDDYINVIINQNDFFSVTLVNKDERKSGSCMSGERSFICSLK